MRSVRLYLIGVCVNSVYNSGNLEKLHVMGILQRLAIGYLFVASLHTLFALPRDDEPQIRDERLPMFQDIISIKHVWILAILLTATHEGIRFGLEIPGCPRGYLGPGGIQDGGIYANCTGGASIYIDSLVFNPERLETPLATAIYKTKPFNSKSLLGCFMFVAQVALGAQCGSTLLAFKGWKARIIRWFVWGLILGLSAGILCKFSRNDGWIPLNKTLWSVSFVLATSSLAFLLLIICYLIVDVLKLWNGFPLVQCSMNSLFLYGAHIVACTLIPFQWRIGLMKTHFVFLLRSFGATIMWVLVAVFMDWKKIYLNL